MSDFGLNISLDYDARDKLFLELLYEGYDISYWCYLDTKHKIERRGKEGKAVEFLFEDLEDTSEVLDAYERLARHYTSGDSYQKKLQDIRDRYEYKSLITKGMSQNA